MRRERKKYSKTEEDRQTYRQILDINIDRDKLDI